MDLKSDDIHLNGDAVYTQDNFKPVFKKYKSRSGTVDFSDVIDFQLDDVCEQFRSACRVDVKERGGSDVCEGLGLEPVSNWRCFNLKTAPGFIFICNPFRPGHQRYWLKRLLKDIPNPTNKTNIKGGLPVDGELIWKQHIRGSSHTKTSLYSKLRWVTLGYHYNWDTKLYDPEDVTAFPDDVGLLSAFIASRFGFKDFVAEAAIVNYYNMSSTLGGHNDHSELDHDAPLISLSFGQSAIFLVGGQTKAVVPTPILLRSGDMIILSAASRLAFHGVPKILHESQEYLRRCWGTTSAKDDRRTPLDLNVKDKKTNFSPPYGENLRTGKGLDKRKEVDENVTASSVFHKEVDEGATSLFNEGHEQCGRINHQKDKIVKTDQQEKLISHAHECDLAWNLGSPCLNFNIPDANTCTELLDNRILDEKRIPLQGDQLAGFSDECTDRFAPDSERQCPVIKLGHPCMDPTCPLDSSDRLSQTASKKSRMDVGPQEEEGSLRGRFPNAGRILQRISQEQEQLTQAVNWEPFERHLQNARMNVSVRQVNVRKRSSEASGN